MTREEIEGRLAELRKNHPSVFIEADYEVVNGTKTRDIAVEQIERKDPPSLEHNAD
jgi:hypothetical protein